MTLAAVKPGDIVLADRKGRRFYAVVTAKNHRELEVEPIDRRVTDRRVKAREVIGIWHTSRATTPGTNRPRHNRPSGLTGAPATALSFRPGVVLRWRTYVPVFQEASARLVGRGRRDARRRSAR